MLTKHFNTDDNKQFITNLTELYPYIQLLKPDYTLADVRNLTPLTLDDYTEDGLYHSFTITPHNVSLSGAEADDGEDLTWEEFKNILTLTARQLKQHNLPETMFLKHFVLTNSHVTLFLTEEVGDFTDFSPVQPDDLYYETLKASESLDVIKSRLVLDFVYSKGFALDEALTAVNMPKEWLNSLYSDLF